MATSDAQRAALKRYAETEAGKEALRRADVARREARRAYQREKQAEYRARRKVERERLLGCVREQLGQQVGDFSDRTWSQIAVLPCAGLEELSKAIVESSVALSSEDDLTNWVAKWLALHSAR